MTRAGSFAANKWRCYVAASAIALALGASWPARATYYYWNDEPALYGPAERSFYRPAVRNLHRHNVRHGQAWKKSEKAVRESSRPQGPLIIAISINQQKLRLYDANGFYAESPVSTGMRGHGTPMGVFSVIQKQRYHRSNIYSGAPMPYMQRITWSGIAIHAGVLPGYPASHGCIRMPTAFAVKMWNWTRLGARVLVTPGEAMTPASFAHALLPAFKVAPPPAAAPQPETNDPVGAKGDKGAPDPKAVNSEAGAGLRATIADRDATPADSSSAPLPDQMHTADASEETVADKVTMSDASLVVSAAQAQGHASKSAETRHADTKPPQTARPAVKPAATAVDQADAAKPNDTPQEPATTSDTTSAPDAKKDQSRLLDDKPAPKHNGQIAVFISGKDSKLYVRQNFAPLFAVPVTIAPSDRPLGTHVFTAAVDRTDANVLHWSVVSLPVSVHAIMRRDADEHHARRHKGYARASESKPLPLPDSPTEALDRISVPPEAMARVAEAMTTGGSIIVSDQGINQGETGEGTDFIVSLR